jgi:putative spermidine/putrescine transport system substrate-binding protein
VAATRWPATRRSKSSCRRASLAGVYVQAISAYAPHPNAAKLWMEYLYSDEGQLGWLKGYCHPIRFNDDGEGRQDPAGTARQAAAGRAYAKACSRRSKRSTPTRPPSPPAGIAVVGANVSNLI